MWILIKPEIVRFKSVTSTNDEAKKSDLLQAVFIADEQTAGRGSKGRSWQSEKNKGLYMSFLIRPRIEPKAIPGLTLMAAVTVCNAIEKYADVNAQIKWPNDVLLNGRKAAGILTESVFGSGGVERVVCGIGINTNQTFSGELDIKAVSLEISDKDKKMLLCEEIIASFFKDYEVFTKKGLAAFLLEFRQRSAVSGNIKIILPSETLSGIFIGFDETGAIIIENENGRQSFIAGEISIRGEHGYV